MLGNLINYELFKKWKHLRILFLGSMALQVVLLILGKVFQGNATVFPIDDKKASVLIIIILFFTIASFLINLPVIENIYRFERDLSGKQAVLELMIPAAAWKKILAKLIAALTTTLLSVLWGALSVLAFFIIFSNFDPEVIDQIKFAFGIIADHPGKSVYVLFLVILGLTFIHLLFFFCTSMAKAFSHKHKIAIPIALIVFILCIILMTFLSRQSAYFPIIWFRILGAEFWLSMVLIWLAATLAAFAGTSWLMERKIEN